MTCATCKRREALANSDNCAECWRKWWQGVCLLSRIRVAQRKERAS